MKKKILVFSLIFTLLCSNNVNADASWFKRDQENNIENICEKKNKCRQLEDIVCAIDKGKEILRGQMDHSTDFKKSGPNCEYNLLLWDYINIKDFYITMGNDLRRAKEGVAFNEILLNVTASIKSIFRTDDEISKNIASYWADNSRFINLDRKEINVDKVAKNNKNNKRNWTGIVGGTVAVVAGVAGWFYPPAKLVETLGHAAVAISAAVVGGGVSAGVTDATISGFQSSNEVKEAQKKLIEVRVYASIVESLLNHIENGDWKEADSVLAKMNFDPDDYDGVVSMLNSKISYSTSQKAGFEQMFKKLEQNLKDIVKTHKSEGWT